MIYSLWQATMRGIDNRFPWIVWNAKKSMCWNCHKLYHLYVQLYVVYNLNQCVSQRVYSGITIAWGQFKCDSKSIRSSVKCAFRSGVERVCFVSCSKICVYEWRALSSLWRTHLIKSPRSIRTETINNANQVDNSIRSRRWTNNRQIT